MSSMIRPGRLLWACAILSTLIACKDDQDRPEPEVSATIRKIQAADDSASDVDGSKGGVVIVDVLANDTLGGDVATTGTVTLSEFSADAGGALSLEADGSVYLAAGSGTGTYSLAYRICEAARSGNCDTAEVTVSVAATTVAMVKGIFMKGEVAGLAYTTDSTSGVTGEDGSYDYAPGDSISFLIGGTRLGETVAARPELSPLDLVPGVDIPESQDELVDRIIRFNYKYGDDAGQQAVSRLKNLVQLLYSVDSDKNMANGIDIDEKVHRALADVELDFALSPKQFSDQFAFRKALFLAFEAEATESARRIRQLPALEHMLDTVGQSLDLHYWSRQTKDNGIDGFYETDTNLYFDARQNYVGKQIKYSSGSFSSSVLEINDFGDVVREQTDSTSSTTVYTWQYDLHGYLTEYERDYKNDGIVDTRWEQTYDDYGNLITKKSISATTTNIQNFEYDSRGNRTLESYDTDGDGTPDSIKNITFDYENHRMFSAYDSDGDGSINSSYEYVDDANGHRLAERYDKDGDGAWDEIRLYSHDADGHLTSSAHDTDADGTPEDTSIYLYDTNGNRILTDSDYDGDGTSDYIVNSAYDSAGNLLYHKWDNDGDGTPDQIYSYNYDARGNRIYYSRDNAADGIPDYIEETAYDDSDNELVRMIDADGNGDVDSIVRSTYNAAGKPTSTTTDSNADGTPDKIQKWTYDVNNLVTLEETDLDADGVADNAVYYDNLAVSLQGLADAP